MAPAIVFVEEEVELCKALMRNGYDRRQLAQQLLSRLIANHLITADDTFLTVKSNVPLMNAISNSIILGLPVEVACSKYGLGIVSDFDLHVNMATDAKFNDFLTNINFDKNRPEYMLLKTNRGNLRRFITRVKNGIVAEFELPETPDAREKKAPATKKSKTDIATDIENDLSTASEKQKDDVMKLFDDEAEEVVKRKDRRMVIRDEEEGESDESSALTNAEEMNQVAPRLYIPVSADFQVPPLELSKPSRPEDSIAFAKTLTASVVNLKHLMQDFKHGTTLMMKYDGQKHKVVLALTMSNEWVNFEHSIQVDLYDDLSKVPGEGTTGLSDLDAMNMNDSESSSRDTSPRVMYADPQTMNTDKRAQSAPQSKLKTRPCKHFSRNGTCALGDLCKFSHSG